MSEKAQEQAKPNLLQKLASVMAEIDNVDKRGRNEFQKYAYVKAADVAWLVRKALSDRNVYLVSDVVEIRNYEIPAKEGHMQAVDLRMEFSFFDGDEPGTLPVVMHSWGTGTDKGDKAVYKAMTGALKYGLRHAFLIPDESDPEADTETDRATHAAKAVGEAKVAELKKKLNGEPVPLPTALFYVEPPNMNGHFVEFLNIPAYVQQKPEQEDSLLLVFSAAKAKKTKGGTTLVPTENVPHLLEALAGELCVTVKRLESPQ